MKIMKKVEFMKLNLQQENLLSKEEKKKILGRGQSDCYVTCGPYGPTDAVPSCESWAITTVCGSNGLGQLGYCICNS